MNMVLDSKDKITFGAQNQESFFYLNYLQYENEVNIHTPGYDPHERLTHFHLAIVEQIGMAHHAIAYQIYLDLASKKEQFLIQDYHFQEELGDVITDIISSLKECGYPASHFEWIA